MESLDVVRAVVLDAYFIEHGADLALHPCFYELLDVGDAVTRHLLLALLGAWS
jgi:hypothetical protein